MTVTSLALLAATMLQASDAAQSRLDRLEACKATGLAAGAPIVVHGRLYAANGGGSGYRIWPVGTKRLLWLSSRVDPALPEPIKEAFVPFEDVLYGDYTLLPLAPDRPGVMREVCLVGGRALVKRNTFGAPGNAASPTSGGSPQRVR